MSELKVVVMGLGYIGLPTASLIASKGISVYGVDVKKEVVEIINKGKIHIIEPDLEALVKKVTNDKKLQAFTTPSRADIFIIAVPTPFKGNFEPDISFVERSVEMIIPYLEKNNLVILESTSPVGTTEKITEIIYNNKPELKNKIFISYCPERVLPGRILYELENNDRVIGGINEESTDKAFGFYSLFVKGKLHRTNAKTAEMCKLVENASRDAGIAFANELSMICDKAGINIWELIELANKHPRVNILTPGVGVGGHCIAVDPWFIVNDFKTEARIIRTAREVNNYKTDWVIEKIINAIEEFEKEKRLKPFVACMGLSYKQDIDDLRESPALRITKELIKKGYNIIPVEPNIKEHKELKLKNYKEAVIEADIIVFLVNHREFKNLILENKIVIDFCGVR